MRKQSIPCNDGLRHRALAKAKGDYEAHEVGQCSNAYASWCDDGNANLAALAEAKLQMFVDTPLRWREANAAACAKFSSTGAKRVLRIKRNLGRWLTAEERKRFWRSCSE